MLCAACLADNDSERDSCTQCGAQLLPQAPGSEAAPDPDGPSAPQKPRHKAVLPEPATAGRNRRTYPRLGIPVGFQLQRLDESGATLEQEYVVAENISRGGARVKTSLESIRDRDVVALVEVGGDFRTRASVRRSYRGPDNVRRLNLQFLDKPAPERLSGTGGVGGSPDLMQRIAKIVTARGDE